MTNDELKKYLSIVGDAYIALGYLCNEFSSQLPENYPGGSYNNHREAIDILRESLDLCVYQKIKENNETK